MDHVAKNTPMHLTWSTVYARNVIHELSPKKQHKVKMVTLFIINEMMVKHFKKTPNGFAYDKQWVVLHNPYLTKMFNAHINVEVFADI
jgi:hypothetical protein